MSKPTGFQPEKLNSSQRFFDLSDYGRPLANRIVAWLLPTSVTSIQVTLFHTLMGFGAAWLIARQQWPWVAAFFLLFKNVMDAVDGGLARARNHPSRVGRFLDSLCDFGVTCALFEAIAFREWFLSGDFSYFFWASLAIFLNLLQGSLLNYYSLRYRMEKGADSTSKIQESDEGYPWDNPRILHILYKCYCIIYGWQDRWMLRLDQMLGLSNVPVQKWFLTAASLFGLGCQLLIISFFLCMGYPMMALWFFIFFQTVYALGLLIFSKIVYPSLSN